MEEQGARNPRAEAAARLPGHDPRVLEPSPPAVDEPPWFADDPVEGGDVLPVERPGATTWAAVCDGRGEAGLRAWCEDRWLVRRPPDPLPDGFAATRASLHALAEHVIAPCRHRANGKIGLRFTFHGFGTPFFGDDRQVRVEDGLLWAGARSTEVTTIAAAAAFVGIEPGAPAGVYTPTTSGDPDRRLEVDAAAARALGDWYGFCASLLEQVRADAGPGDDPSRVQLWPEHFDLAVDVGPEFERANYGGSPGDAAHAEPYLYVGPWVPREGEFWNEPFGASLSFSQIRGGADPLEFLRTARAHLRS